MLLIKNVLFIASFLTVCLSSGSFLPFTSDFIQEFRQLASDPPVPLKVDNETENIQSLADYNKVVGNIVSIGAAVEQLALPGTSSGISTVNSVNVMQFVRYINITYPDNVNKLFKAQGLKTTQFNFGPLFPPSLIPYAREYKPSARFSNYQITSLFLVNYWKTIITIPILILAAGFVILIGKLRIKHPLFVKGYAFVRNFILWNFLISFVLSNVDSLTIWSIVELRNLRLDAPVPILSFCINITLVVSALVLLVIFTRKAYLISKKEKKTASKDKLEKYTPVKVLFEELKSNYLHQELFFSVLVIRIVANNLVIGLVNQPVVQVIFLLTTNVLLMIYILFGRPYISRIRNLELFCYETTTLVVNIVCVRLAFMDNDEQRASQVDASAMIKSTVSVSTLSIFFSVLKNGVMIFNVVKAKLAERKKTDKRSYAKESELQDAKQVYLETENENEKSRLTEKTPEDENSKRSDIIQVQKKSLNHTLDGDKTDLGPLDVPKRSASSIAYFPLPVNA